MTMTHATAPAPAAPKWQAGLYSRRIRPYRLVETDNGEIKAEFWMMELLYVVLERGDDFIPFCASWPKGRLTFSDSRECWTGTAGSTGQWGTRQPSKPGKRRTLTPTAWKAEVSRLIGSERADQIIRLLSRGNPLF